MAEPYLGQLCAIVERSNALSDVRAEIDTRHFFSGAAAYVNGAIFMSLTPAGLALKLSDEDCHKLLQHGGRPLRYFPKSPIKKEYVVMPSKLVDDRDTLNEWISRSIRQRTY